MHFQPSYTTNRWFYRAFIHENYLGYNNLFLVTIDHSFMDLKKKMEIKLLEYKKFY